jgi:DNA modification methylase
MAPGIALDGLGEHKKPLRVLDPMVGSGTVLAVARSRGHRAHGIDMDPLAILLSKVWTTTLDAGAIQEKAREVLDRAKDRFRSLSMRDSYPTGSDEETREFVRFWFDDYARRQLAALSQAIAGVRDNGVRDVLWCGFSRLIISKQSGASLAKDLSHSRPHRAFDRAPAKPFPKFLRAVEMVVDNCPQIGQGPVGPAAIVKRGDARALPLPDSSIDLVLTSPPYLNAIDYIRCSKFSLVWMGHHIVDLRGVRSDSIGSELSSDVACDDKGVKEVVKELRLRPQLDARDNSLLCQYVYDMRQAVGEAARVLVPGGRAVYVVGDSTVRGTFIRNSAVVTAVAELAGLRANGRRTRSLPPNRRYLPPPSAQKSEETIDARMRCEVILSFRRPAA